MTEISELYYADIKGQHVSIITIFWHEFLTYEVLFHDIEYIKIKKDFMKIYHIHYLRRKKFEKV